jgi:hypothetical protein
MMDHLTLEDCSSIVVSAREAKYEDTIMLTANEHAAYIRVRSGQLLLEQEKIPIRMPWHDSFLHHDPLLMRSRLPFVLKPF